MKMDLDSFLYIIITIVVLVISGLGGRKKKKLQQMTPANPQRFPEDSGEEEYFSSEEDFIEEEPQVNPMERFEQFLTGQEPTLTRQAPSITKRAPSITKQAPSIAKQAPSISMRTPLVESLEGESLEDTMDEEELIMNQIRKDRAELLNAQKDYYKDRRMPQDEEELQDNGKKEIVSTEKLQTTTLLGLFNNTDEIKKAIIYSEIFKRKY